MSLSLFYIDIMKLDKTETHVPKTDILYTTVPEIYSHIPLVCVSISLLYGSYQLYNLYTSYKQIKNEFI